MNRYDDDAMPSLCPCCREPVDFRDTKPDPKDRARLICKGCARRRGDELREEQQ